MVMMFTKGMKTMFERMSPRVKSVFGYVIICFVPLLFVLALFVGNGDPAEEETVEKPVKDYEPPETEPSENKMEVAAIVPPSEDDKREARRVAIHFIKAFHSLDVDKPTEYIEEARLYMRDEMYQQYKGIPKRGTLESQKIEVVGVDALPSELQDYLQIWTVGVTSAQTNASDTEVLVFDQYSILLHKIGAEWKVNGVKIIE